jgi:glycosyltransferase involved in cell wall biosynthesis
MDLSEYTPDFQPGNYALYFGRLAPIKGISTLLGAIRQLRSLPLVIAGDGEMKNELAAEIVQHGLDNVRLVGHLNGKELKETIGGARFVIVPSECYENAPFAVFESFALGKAVIASRIGGIPELITDGHNGLLFTPGHSNELAAHMAFLQEQPDVCLSMGENGRRMLQTSFAPSKHFDRLEEIYRSLMLLGESNEPARSYTSLQGVANEDRHDRFQRDRRKI